MSDAASSFPSYAIGTVFESAYKGKKKLKQALVYNPKVLIDTLDYKELIKILGLYTNAIFGTYIAILKLYYF